MPFEIFYPHEDNMHGSGVLLQKYKGTVSLVAANKSMYGGTIWMRWCQPLHGKKLSDKQIPIKVDLGSPREAVKLLKEFLSRLEVDDEV